LAGSKHRIQNPWKRTVNPHRKKNFRMKWAESSKEQEILGNYFLILFCFELVRVAWFLGRKKKKIYRTQRILLFFSNQGNLCSIDSRGSKKTDKQNDAIRGRVRGWSFGKIFEKYHPGPARCSHELYISRKGAGRFPKMENHFLLFPFFRLQSSDRPSYPQIHFFFSYINNQASGRTGKKPPCRCRMRTARCESQAR